MDGPGNQFFARAAFSLNQNRDVCVGHLLHDGLNLPHLPAVLEKPIEFRFAFDLFPQVSRLIDQIPSIHLLPDRGQQLLLVKGLVKKILRPHLHRRHNGLRGPLAAHHHDVGVRIDLLHLLEGLQAVLTGELQIQKNKGGTNRSKHANRLLPGIRAKDLIAEPGHKLTHVNEREIRVPGTASPAWDVTAGDVITWNGPLSAGSSLVLTYLLAVSPTAVPVSFYGVAFVQEETGGTWERTAWVQVFPLRLYLPFVRRGW